MAFRRGSRHQVDSVAGPLELHGDGFAAAGDLVTLVAAPDVHRFIGMSAAEAAAAQRIVSQYREQLSGSYEASGGAPPDHKAVNRVARDAADALRTLLGGDRFARLRALSWRIRDGDALLDDDVAAHLELSPRQRADLAAMAETNARETAAIMREISRTRLAGPGEVHERAALEDLRGSQRLLGLLLPGQRRQFERLKTTGDADREPS
jgi:hypothetical protein